MFAVKCLIMIRTALTGSEKFLRHYMEIIMDHPEFIITGVHLHNHKTDSHSGSFSIEAYSIPYEKLHETSDALIVTDKAGECFDLISRFLKKSRHVLILPDLTLSCPQLKKLTKIADEAGVILNLHHKTLNGVIKQKIREYIFRPEYIFLKSQITAKPARENFTIFSALYRYIYLIVELNPVNPVKYYVTGIPVCSTEPRILDVNIQFENGTSAHLNISSCFKEEYEKLEIFGHDRMITIDPSKNEFLIIQSHPDEIKNKSLSYACRQNNEDVLTKFYKSITGRNGSENRISSGIVAHQLASGILHQIHPAPVED